MSMKIYCTLFLQSTVLQFGKDVNRPKDDHKKENATIQFGLKYFPILAQNIYCGYMIEKCTHNLKMSHNICLKKIKKISQLFLWKFLFLHL